MEPLLEFVPECITTPRLIVRSPRASDGAALNAAVIESMEALRPYMPWAQSEPSLAQSEGECRRMQARVLLLKNLRQRFRERCYDYKRFRVEAQQERDAKIGDGKKQ